MNLYRAYSILEEFEGCKNVLMNWYYGEPRDIDIEYSKAIEDYSTNNEDQFYDNLYVDELFRTDEISELRNFLANIGISMGVDEVDIPIKHVYYPFSAIPSSRCHGNLILKAKETGLSFDVGGYYDLRQCDFLPTK